ncbi:branched-chain amino acid ABC transporter permease [soil metagenome]
MLGSFETLVLSGLFVTVALATLLPIQFGLTGIVKFGIVGLWGLGLYIGGVLMVSLELPFLVALIAATLITGALAFILGWFILDLDSQAVLVATLAFATIVFQVMQNATAITKGAIGLGTVRFPFTIERGSPLHEAGVTTQIAYLGILVLVALVMAWYARRVRGQPFGRLLVAISGNERLARSLGKDTFRQKLVVFTITSALMGSLGALQGPVQQFLTPTLLLPTLTFAVWIGLVLGGKGHWAGGLVGVLILGLTFDIGLDWLDLPRDWGPFMAQFKYVIYGALLIVLIMFRPQGLLGTYAPSPPRSDADG